MVLGLFTLIPVMAIAGDIVGEIISVEGKVTLRDDKARKKEAKVGMTVEVGQMIKTSNSGKIKIRLADESVFKIASGSTFILDNFLLEGSESRQMKARMLKGALQYISKTVLFKKDSRKILLANTAGAIRGTNFIGVVGRRIEAVLISGRVDFSARSNTVTLDKRGHAVTFEMSGKFEAVVLLPDSEIAAFGDRLGWKVELPSPVEGGARALSPTTCKLVGSRIFCG